MILPDFEIDVRLRAEQLVSYVPPNAQTETEGEEVMLDRRETRHRVSAHSQPAGHDDVAVDKHVVGRLTMIRAGKERL